MIVAASQAQDSDQHLASLSKLAVQAHGILSDSSYHSHSLPPSQCVPLACTLASAMCAALQRMTCAQGTEEMGEVDAEAAERVKALVVAATGTVHLLLLRSFQSISDAGSSQRPPLPLACALVERLLWLHGTGVAAARACGRVDWAWALCERADTGSASLSRAVELLGMVDALQQAAEADRTAQLQAGMDEQARALGKRLAAIHNAVDLLLPLQHSLHWDDPVILARWQSPSFLPPTSTVDISTAPFLPVQRPKVPLVHMLAALTVLASRQSDGTVSTFLSACPLPRWRSYIGYVEGKVVAQMKAQAQAHARAEEEVAQEGVMDVGESSPSTSMHGARLRRRKAASLLALYRDGDSAATAASLAQVTRVLAGGREGVHLPWTPAHFVPLGPIGRLLRHTLRCVGPLHHPEATLPFFRDRARLLLRMASMGAQQLPSAYANRPDIALVCSVTREAAGLASYIDKTAQYRLRSWPFARGRGEEDERAAHAVMAAVAASKPADKLVVKLCAGLMMHMRGPTPGSYAARAGVESPRPWQMDIMRMAGRVGVHTGTGTAQQQQQAALSHAVLSRLSVPQAALVDYLFHRSLDTVQCWMLLALAARLLGEPFALMREEEGLGDGRGAAAGAGGSASPTAVAAERLSSLLALYDQVSACHALPQPLLLSLRDTSLRWAALLTASEGGGGGKEDGSSLMHRMVQLSQRTGEHEEWAGGLPMEEGGPQDDDDEDEGNEEVEGTGL